jgi:hypothetical protein
LTFRLGPCSPCVSSADRKVCRVGLRFSCNRPGHRLGLRVKSLIISRKDNPLIGYRLSQQDS